MAMLGEMFEIFCECAGMAWNRSGFQSVYFERDLNVFKVISDKMGVEFLKKIRYDPISRCRLGAKNAFLGHRNGDFG